MDTVDYTLLAPRRPRYVLVSPRQFLDAKDDAANPDPDAHENADHIADAIADMGPGENPDPKPDIGAKNAPPHIHAVLACDTPCCTETIYPAIHALASQSLTPTHLTLIHACPEQKRKSFHKEVRRALADPSSISTSFTLRPHTFLHPCPAAPLEPCVLDYLAHLSNTAAANVPHYSMLFSDRVLLEHTAVEKSWLSLVNRPHVISIRFQSYNFSSLQRAEREADPVVARPIWPILDPSTANPVIPIPLMYVTSAFRECATESYIAEDPHAHWLALIRVVANARLLREPLCTLANTENQASPPLFSFGRFSKQSIPPHLFSELAFHKWSARHDEEEMYSSNLKSSFDVDMTEIAHWPVRKKGKNHIMLIMPWMQMGGSEKCMLDIAESVIQHGWGVTFVFTMPFWADSPIGEVYLRHEWYSRALHLTSDVFDLLNLATDKSSSRLFRYLLETRHPEFVLMANSRWAYPHAPFIKSILPGAIVADYNHMIHMAWEGGGMPRFGANSSEHFDLHLTASHDVRKAMKTWIAPEIMIRDPERVQTCYIGTNSSLLYSEGERAEMRMKMREKHGVAESAMVVLFAGRLVVDKGIDVVAEVVKQVANDTDLQTKLAFVFVGSGDQKSLLTRLPVHLNHSSSTFVVVEPPATGIEELRDYYAMSDIFLLPSVNEGIALVLYEAMADGLLVMATDVGGQHELVREDTGILLKNHRSVAAMVSHTINSLRTVLEDEEKYLAIRQRGSDLVRSEFTTKQFTECVMENLVRVKANVDANDVLDDSGDDSKIDKWKLRISRGLDVERYHGKWNLDAVERGIEGYVTVGIKTYVCDHSIMNQVRGLVRSIRVHHKKVRILLGNDGPTVLATEDYVRDDPYTEEIRMPTDSGISFGRNVMVNLTTTRFFVLLDDDHIFDETTDLRIVVRGIDEGRFDIVGLRVRNLPGIDEYERIGILIPRYVALIRKLENYVLTLCVWNENRGPSIYGITHPISVDVLHNAFMASTDVLRAHPWRNELKVNEHMTFFLDAKDAHLKVGYLPSVFVHHRARQYSDCYHKVRFREDKFRNLLRYKDKFDWDVNCGMDFPNRVKQHIKDTEYEQLT